MLCPPLFVELSGRNRSQHIQIHNNIVVRLVAGVLCNGPRQEHTGLIGPGQLVQGHTRIEEPIVEMRIKRLHAAMLMD